jgi:exonuclease SbcC
VLIHGPNGAGKTSILSAIELALTGEVPAMRRTDPTYQAHLVHRGAELSRIVLSTGGLEAAIRPPSEIIVRSGILEGLPILQGDERRFFSERCYLAQSTLSRLLEIYQNAKRGEGSPLTQFVKDLLGLDQLDALIDGLHATNDVRNVRRLAPEYADAEKARDATAGRLAETQRNLGSVSVELSKLRDKILTMLSSLGSIPLQSSLALPDGIEAIMEDNAEEIELIALNGYRRDLASLRQRVGVTTPVINRDEQRVAEEEENTARADLERWWSVAGKRLENVIEHLRESFPDLPSVAATDPTLAHKTALERVSSEIGRCNEVIVADDFLITQFEDLGQAIEKSHARISIADEQISQIAGETEDLRHALAAIAPHIHDENCPVCGRDFAEHSSEPLVQHVLTHVARLTEQASRLQSLGRSRLEARNDLTRLERDLSAVAAQRLTQDGRVELKARISSYLEPKRELEALTAQVGVGATVMRREAEARRRLSEIHARDRFALETRAAIAQLCAALDQPPLDVSESIGESIVRLDAHLMERQRNLTDRQARRREAVEQLRRYRVLEGEVSRLERAIDSDTALKTRQDAALQAAEASRNIAKSVASAAADARADIVGRVFNSALNKVWRDLFVRLAPNEPYVPAFRLPRTASEPVVAHLETVHREGGVGGAPGAMLSAGNLNTAALTLFLALHLSVKPNMPWLILDDPVQSMDDVHISQFAALLRTPSKEHRRQVVIAVHDRPLFDYLALELSPAFPSDQLITIELTRSLDGSSIIEPTFRHWEPDRAVAA